MLKCLSATTIFKVNNIGHEQEIAKDESIVPSQKVQLEVNSGEPNKADSESPIIPEPELFLIVEYDTEPELNYHEPITMAVRNNIY